MFFLFTHPARYKYFSILITCKLTLSHQSFLKPRWLNTPNLQCNYSTISTDSGNKNYPHLQQSYLKSYLKLLYYFLLLLKFFPQQFRSIVRQAFFLLKCGATIAYENMVLQTAQRRQLTLWSISIACEVPLKTVQSWKDTGKHREQLVHIIC